MAVIPCCTHITWPSTCSSLRMTLFSHWFHTLIVFRPCATVVNNHDIRQLNLWAITYAIFFPTHDRHLLGSGPQAVFRQHPMWTTMRSGNPIYELLYEFRLHCHLLGNLRIQKSTIFDNNGFRSRETLNCINSSGIWGPTRHSPLKNKQLLSCYKIEETTKNLNQVGQ